MAAIYRRYAIYWTPREDTPLDVFGKRWFGGACFGVSPDLAARAIEAPAHYGLHATLKAPFPLAKDASLTGLQTALDVFCAARRGPGANPLGFIRLQNYLALGFGSDPVDIGWLAAECVTHFDRFRGALEERDRAQPSSPKLSPRQSQYLAEFGYPHILAEFRFHISLAGPLAGAELLAVQQGLAPSLERILTEPFRMRDLTLLGEPAGSGRFESISRHAFRH